MVKLRKKKLASGRISLYLDIYINGKRYYEFLKLQLVNDGTNNKETLKLAETIRAKRQIELQCEQYGLISDSRKKINLIQYLNQSSKDKNHSTQVMTKCLINYVEKYSKNIVLSEVNEKWIADLEKYISGFVSNTSVANYIDALKTSLNRAVKEKLIMINPFQYVVTRIKKTESQRNYLTIEELSILAKTECGNNEVKRAFLFGCFSGLRISDIKNLKLDDIKDNMLEYRMKKTNKIQHLPLGEFAKSLISGGAETNVIDLHNNGKVFELPGMNTILSYINDWVKAAGISKHITTHCARHTFATLSLTQGVDLFTVSKLLGHSNVGTTQIYAKIIDQKKIEAVNKLPNLKMA